MQQIPLLLPVISGTAIGTFSRLVMLRSDYRHYPSMPHGYAIHLALGFIAAFIGSVAVPAVVERHWEAATFLVLAAQQFREIRKMERDSLSSLEETELVHRGSAYIEAIAKVFEARNYIAIIIALAVSLTNYLLITHITWLPRLGLTWHRTVLLSSLLAALFGLLLLGLLARLLHWRTIGEIARVEPARLRFEGAKLMVEDVVLMNVGGAEVRRIIQERGLALVIAPKNDNANATLANLGQRQAIAHDAATVLGISKDQFDPEFTPLVRRSLKTGRLVMVIVPIEPDLESLVAAVKRVPVLESVVRRPLATRAGRAAAD